MAKKVLNTRRYWIVPGDVDARGQPIKYSSPPTQTSKGANIGSGGLLGQGASASPAVEYMEQVYDDGDVVISRYDPQAKDWVQEDVQVDTARRGAYESDRAAAEKAAAAEAKPPDTISAPPTQKKIVTQDATGKITERDNPNWVAPETISRPAPSFTAAGEAVPGATEQVSKTQADYERQTAQDRQAAMQQAVANSNAAAQQAREEARLRIEKDRWTAEQAHTEYNKKLDQIKLEGDALMRQITQRGQDIQVRGQDVSAGVTQRGQNLDYETSLAGHSTSMANALLPYMNAPGQIESYNSLMAGGPPMPTQPGTPPPFNPATFPQQAALAARAQMPSPYQLPGTPPQVPTNTGYVLG